MWHVAWITYVAPSHGVQATSYNEHRERNNNNIKANSIARLQLLFLVFSSLLTFFLVHEHYTTYNGHGGKVARLG